MTRVRLIDGARCGDCGKPLPCGSEAVFVSLSMLGDLFCTDCQPTAPETGDRSLVKTNTGKEI